MNKHRFRLIFSKPLGFLIPVAENNHAQGKPGQTSGPCAATQANTPPFPGSLKALPLALLASFAQPGFAEILPEPGQRIGMTQSSSGVPVMEIADPNGKGLSHNRFQEFNVGKPGLIFNNSLRDGTSQIGGFVVHNPNLTREARAILTEVSGPNATSLAGILEVFGGKADILIAKPNQNPVSSTDVPPKHTDTPDAPDAPDAPNQKSTSDLDTNGAPKTVKGGDDPETDTPTQKRVTEDKTIEIATAKEVVNDKTVTGPSNKPVGDFPTTPIKDRIPSPETVKTTQDADTDTVAGAGSGTGVRRPEHISMKPANHSVNYDGYQKQVTAARETAETTTGVELKKALNQLNSADQADRAALKDNPVNINVKQPNGKVVSYEIKDMGSMLRLHGQKVAPADLPANFDKTTAPNTELYIHVKPSSTGGYTYSFEATPPK